MEVTKKVKGTVVIGVIGDDIHTMGVDIMQHALTDAGFKVVTLGVRSTQEEFIHAAIETKADAIFVSTLSGHGWSVCSGLRDKCIETGLKDIILYVGGKLIIGEPPWQETEKLFKEMGFDRAYPPRTLPGPPIADLEADLMKKRGG